MGLPEDLVFRTEGQLAIDILTEAFAGGVRLDFVCGDEVYGSCTQLREFCEGRGQAYVLRGPSSFPLVTASGITLTCKQAAARLGSRRGWEIRSAGTGSKGQRWYAWAWLGTASPRHHLLIRRHLQTGELAFCYCFLPEGQPASPSRPVRAAGRRPEHRLVVGPGQSASHYRGGHRAPRPGRRRRRSPAPPLLHRRAGRGDPVQSVRHTQY
jgi:hypothetical protein